MMTLVRPLISDEVQQNGMVGVPLDPARKEGDAPKSQVTVEVAPSPKLHGAHATEPATEPFDLNPDTHTVCVKNLCALEDSIKLKQSYSKGQIYVVLAWILTLLSLYCIRSPVFGLNSDTRLQYALVLDAGSTGSRMHVFSFRGNFLSGSFVLVDSHVKKTDIVFSHFSEDKNAVAKAMMPLLAFGEGHVPMAMQPSTPLMIYATGGLQTLPEDEAKDILDLVNLEVSRSIFRTKRAWSRVIHPEEEAIFAWSAVSYLLLNDNVMQPRLGILDLGGASVQVAVPYLHKEQEGEPGVWSAHPVVWTAHPPGGIGQYPMYTTSEQGLGLLEARKTFMNLGGEGKDKCGMMGFSAGTAWWECTHAIHQGLFQSRKNPPMADMPITEGVTFYLFSLLYDRTVGLGLAIKEDATLAELTDAGIQVCSARTDADLMTQLDSEHLKLGPKISDLGMLCFDLAYIFTMLHSVMRFSLKERHLRFINNLDGMDLSWALGAVLNSIDRTGEPIVPQNIDLKSGDVAAPSMPERELMCPRCSGGSPADASHGALYMWLWVSVLASFTLWQLYQEYHHRFVMLTALRRCPSDKDVPKASGHLTSQPSQQHCQGSRLWGLVQEHVLERESSTMGRRNGSRLDMEKVEETIPLISTPRSSDEGAVVHAAILRSNSRGVL